MGDFLPGQRVRIDGGNYKRDYGTVSDQDLTRAVGLPYRLHASACCQHAVAALRGLIHPERTK